MHLKQREALILKLLAAREFMTSADIQRCTDASSATVRRDMQRLEHAGRIVRARGGARLVEHALATSPTPQLGEDVPSVRAAKANIGRAAAQLCKDGEAIIICGGSTTLHLCPHIAALKLHVFTNSIPVMWALSQQPGTRLSLPSGSLFREQNIILSPFDADGMQEYRAARIFFGAAAIGPYGPMQKDIIVAHADRRLMGRAAQRVLLVHSAKFRADGGHVVCALEELQTIVTDEGLPDRAAQIAERAGVQLIIAPRQTSEAEPAARQPP